MGYNDTTNIIGYTMDTNRIVTGYNNMYVCVYIYTPSGPLQNIMERNITNVQWSYFMTHPLNYTGHILLGSPIIIE